jgi:proteasome lid subunit RPN8/RPN11
MLKLQVEHLNAIATHATSTYPDECCGILLGKIDREGKTLVEIWQTENAWSAETTQDNLNEGLARSKQRRYAIAPLDLLKAQKYACDRQLDVIGFYHSHPDCPAIPSECDRSCAWQQYSYIIISVPQGQAGDFRSWQLDDNHQFQSEAIATIDGKILVEA